MVENDEVILFHITPRGLRESTTWTMRGGGKESMSKSQVGLLRHFVEKVIKELLHHWVMRYLDSLWRAWHARDMMLSEIRTANGSRSNFRRNRNVGTGWCERSAPRRPCRRITRRLCNFQRISLLEEAWKRISLNGAVAYGEAELVKSMNEGLLKHYSSPLTYLGTSLLK